MCPRLTLRLVPQILHRFVRDRHTCAFGDGVPGTQNSRHPRFVALEHSCGGKWDQRIHERELVIELTDACQAFTHQCDRLIGVVPTHRQYRANIQCPGHEPRARTPSPLSAMPVPDGIASARNLSILRKNISRAASTLPSACST